MFTTAGRALATTAGIPGGGAVWACAVSVKSSVAISAGTSRTVMEPPPRRISIEVAGHHVIGRRRLQLRVDPRALRHRERTTRMEVASRGRIDRRRYLAAENQVLARRVRVGGQRRREERLREGMERGPVQRFGAGVLHDPPEIHDRGAMRVVPNRGKVVSDQKIAELLVGLEVLQ